MRADDPTVLLLTDPAMAGHAWPGHPERPERAPAVTTGVTEGAHRAGAQLVVRSAEPATTDEVAMVHDPSYVRWLASISPADAVWLDPDTYVIAGSVDAALRAVGLAVAAAEAVATGEAQVAFAVVRPPGHHAHAESGKGFCLLNNVVLAATRLRRMGAARRIAILDWDVHHGDGTQSLVGADRETFYGSTHQYPWYPGTGSRAENRETVVNEPLPAGSGDEAFVHAWQTGILPAVKTFAPDAILLSAGYDAHRIDPLAGLAVTAGGFRSVAAAVGASARGSGLGGVALVLEGGYDLEALRTSAAATVEGLLQGLGSGPGPRPEGSAAD